MQKNLLLSSPLNTDSVSCIMFCTCCGIAVDAELLQSEDWEVFSDKKKEIEK